MNEQIDQLADFLDRHRNVLVLTGAGLSTASGIPGYRDEEGVRRGRAPVQGPEFRRNDAVRRRYWARSMVGWQTLAQASPNAGHRALALLEKAGRVGNVITQNVDGLHLRAGSSRLIELHGNIHMVRCLACERRQHRAALQERLLSDNPAFGDVLAQPLPDGDAHVEPESLEGFIVPTCDDCGGVLQPDVVFFGDNVPPERTRQALQWMDDADALLVVGSSLMVFSGYRFCKLAAAAGKPIAAVNAGKTRADDLIGLKLALPAQEVLPAVAGLLAVT
ncbi:NAD-dependent SIR2 family protein deacetylase [Pseudoduganella flava]|uniref:protein acetyllysine N-acetyltransferase n=1 Tax=Pseudoduganella flava TaxID=871742 RepID=A0A562Q0I9_9BURK|nr:NAD-dependent protein deacetylase [Pseudoduganella flava]QGZ38310.1 NAD-dependent protein deacetylase [Pseudoduganella flava]TWI50153.1 NAD-dependent SIR2 family protein deacetylase [Pseudoduganella flava]